MSTNASRPPITVFVSYSHKDEQFRKELVKHLSILKRQGVISEWHDRKIIAGSEWAGEIDAHLNTAQIILLLISADFLASNYCYDVELKRAMERHEASEAHVVPVILRPVDWNGSPFGKLQALPKDAKPITTWSNRDLAYEDIAKGIKQRIENYTVGIGQKLSYGDPQSTSQRQINNQVAGDKELVEKLKLTSRGNVNDTELPSENDLLTQLEKPFWTRFTCQVSPAHLLRWLPSETVKRSVVVFDLEPDVLDVGYVHLDVNVVINVIPIRRRRIDAHVDYYVGCGGAQVEIEAINGHVMEHTSERVLSINSQTPSPRKRTSHIRLVPESTPVSSRERGFRDAGNVSLEAGADVTFVANYSGTERVLVPLNLGRSVRWMIFLPRGGKKQSDFMSGNFYLFANCLWKSLPASGSITVNPSDVRFFDPERRPIGKVGSIAMEYILWKKGIRLANIDGLTINFKITE